MLREYYLNVNTSQKRENFAKNRRFIACLSILYAYVLFTLNKKWRLHPIVGPFYARSVLRNYYQTIFAARYS